MPEYIMKEQALGAIRRTLELTGKEWAEIYFKIKNIPAADVVGVVRCKDCINKRNCYIYDVYAFDDFFCLFGARMDGGESDD